MAFSGAQRLGQQLDPVPVAHGSQYRRAVGALAAPSLQEARVSGRVEHAGDQAFVGLMRQQGRMEVAQDTVVEVRVGQV